MTAKKEPSWYRIAYHSASLFYFLLGVGVGATVAVFTGLAKMQPDLANLLGGLLGAGIGAFGAGMISVWLYQKQRIDQFRPKAKELCDRYYPLEVMLAWVDQSNRTAASIDMLHHWIEKTLEDGKANEVVQMGVQINDLNNRLRLEIRDIRHQMDTAEFDRGDVAAMREFARDVGIARDTLKQLQPQLLHIANTD
jgi:hypothetical protein